MSAINSITDINNINVQQADTDNTASQDQVASTGGVGAHVTPKYDISGMSKVLAATSSIGYVAGAADDIVGLVSDPSATSNNQDNLGGDAPRNMAITIAMAMGGSFDAEQDLQAISEQKELAAVLENNFFEEISGLSNADKIKAMNSLKDEFGSSALVSNAIKDIKSQADDLQTIEDERVEHLNAGNKEKHKGDHMSGWDTFCGFFSGHSKAYYYSKAQGEFDQANELQAQENQITSKVTSKGQDESKSFISNSNSLTDDFNQLLQIEASLGDMATSRGQ